MKRLCATLTFVLGLVMGPIIVLASFFGVLFGMGSAMTVGEIQSSLSDSNLIKEDGPLYGDKLIDVLKTVMQDYQNFHEISLKTLKEHYGFDIFDGIYGVDFKSKPDFYEMSFEDFINKPSVVLDYFTLRDIESLTGIKISSYDLPILQNNLDRNLNGALDEIVGSLNGDLSIHGIKANFGIDLGVEDNDMLKSLQFVKLSDFGSMLDALKVDTLLDVDTDTFLPLNADMQVYQKMFTLDQETGEEIFNCYEPVPAGEVASRNLTPGVETYIAGTTEDGALDERELRYVLVERDGENVYEVDNSCYDEKDEDDAQDEEQTTFYRHVMYKPYSGNASSNVKLYVQGYANRIANFQEAAEGIPGTTPENAQLLVKEFVSLDDIMYKDESQQVTLATKVSGGKVKIDENVGYMTDGENEGDPQVPVNGELYAFTDEGEDFTKDSLLAEVEKENAKYVRVHKGDATAILQTINFLSISELSDAGDLLDGLRVRDVIEINDDTAKILVTLQNEKIMELGDKINDLTIDDMMDIEYTVYEEADNGIYVYYTDSSKPEQPESYYTLYNPAAGRTGTRLNKVPANFSFKPDNDGEYYRVTDENGKTLYYTKTPQLNSAKYAKNDNGETEKEYSSSVLQRLSSASFDSFSDSFDSLLLSDVMDIEPDIYVEATKEYMNAHANVDYFYYSADVDLGDDQTNIYKRADADFRSGHPDVTYYYVAQHGSSNAVLKKLAFVPVNEMADSFDAVLDDMLLSEIMDINKNYAIDKNTTEFESDKYFVEWTEDAIYSTGTKGEDAAIYVYDNENGKYIRRKDIFVQAETNDYGQVTPKEYYYKQISASNFTSSDNTSIVSLYNNYNLYYKTGDEKSGEGKIVEPYLANRELALYVANKERTESTGLTNTKIYYRVEGNSNTGGATIYSGKQYDANDLYVDYVQATVGTMKSPNPTYERVKYDKDNPAFWDMDVLYKKVTVSDSDSDGAFVPMDALEYNYTATDQRYSKVYCEDIYVLDNNGDYVYDDATGIYTEDPEKTIEADQRFKKVTGAVLDAKQAYNDNTSLFKEDVKRFGMIREKSAPVLQLLADSTLNNLNDTLDKAELGNIMDITPGTIFDDPTIKSAKLNELGDKITMTMTTMTIGKLIEWSNISDIDPSVKKALETATVTSFFASLKYDMGTGQIYVDLEELLVPSTATTP